MDPSDPLPPLPPSLAGRFTVEGILGRGAMGLVLAARDRELDREVAIKLLPSLPDQDSLSRFRREAGALAKLVHPHVVRLLQFSEDPTTPALVMERVRGRPLGDLLHRAPAAKVEAWLVQVAGALDAVHAAGLVHRDVKPGNIMVDEADRAVLVDFGLVRTRRESATQLTADGDLVGTITYMAPECLQAAPATPASDWYSWGAILFERLEGRPPHPAERLLAYAVGTRDLAEPTLARTPAPDPRGRVALRQLSRDPARRLGGQASLAAALAGQEVPEVVGRPGSAPDPAAPPRAPGPPRARVPLPLLASGATLLFLAWLLLAPSAEDPLPEPPPAASDLSGRGERVAAARARLESLLEPIAAADRGELAAPGGWRRSADERVRIAARCLEAGRVPRFRTLLATLQVWLKARFALPTPLEAADRTLFEELVFPVLGRLRREEEMGIALVSWSNQAGFRIGPAFKVPPLAEGQRIRATRLEMAEAASAAWAELPRPGEGFGDHMLVLETLLGSWDSSGDVRARVEALAGKAARTTSGPMAYWLRRAASAAFLRVITGPMPEGVERVRIGRLMFSAALKPTPDATHDELVDLYCEQLLTWGFCAAVGGRNLEAEGELERVHGVCLLLHIYADTHTASIKPWMWVLADHFRWLNLAGPAAGDLTKVLDQLVSMGRE